ncbi:LPS-assembly lipoprotein LptE [Effusibacillus dendaii]|uniref:Lipoprotein n=1 Tax=Effusibacillus dendaii TaxID=2743772 RepID=A0A7I8DD90_9BACL|nr:hypothetical protein [Effusibacillus dendaii]BCJ88065.1 hypothetical protein skT53_30500 [Effusibacillus dendaii]
MRYVPSLLIGLAMVMLTGCGTPNQTAPKAKGLNIQAVGEQGPISDSDIPAVEQQLRNDIKIKTLDERPLKITQTAHTKKVSYVLFSMPNNDGLAVVTKQGGSVRILERLPIVSGDPKTNLVSYNTIIAGNRWDPDNGVLFGMVYNPYITGIEAYFRDTTKVKVDVKQSRGFIIVRPGTDTRFVQINAIGEGGLWWTSDSR